MENNTGYDSLKQQILSCRICQKEFGYQPHPIVFGHENSKVMQISQAPSKRVHETLKPFNDASGRKLKQEWYHIDEDVFYNQDNFYIVSIAHCYPGKAGTKGDRLPPKVCAERWLKRELELVNNEIYILVGGVAARHFFPKHEFSSLVFEDQEINGKPAYVLPHPSPLNSKWLKDHPRFLEARIFAIRKTIHKILELEKI